MTYLAAAVVLVGALCLLNLLLTFGVIRRLRARDTVVQTSTGFFDPATMIGRNLPDFTATTDEGRPVSRDDLREHEYLIGVFSGTCEPCHEQAPRYAAAMASAAERRRSLALVVGEESQTGDLRSVLREVPRVTGADSEKLVELFGIEAFPMFLSTDRTGRVTHATPSMAAAAAAAASRS